MSEQQKHSLGSAAPPGAEFRRRTFLKMAGAASAAFATAPFSMPGQDTAPQLGAEEASAPTLKSIDDPQQLRVLLHEADYSPSDAARARALTVRDLPNDPLPQAIAAAEGRARVSLAPEPMQLSVRLKVPGFGEVYCYADNQGAGYTKPGQIEFVVEAAATRLRRVRELDAFARKLSVPNDPEVERHLEAAGQPIPGKAGAKQVAAAYQALSHGLHAGERLTLNLARYRIAKLAKPRSEFLFGCLVSDWHLGPEFNKAFTALFNYGVLGWYSWSQNAEPRESRIDYARMDQSLEWCLARKIVPKNFGYVYLANGATPEWIRQWPYEKVLPEYKRIVAQTTRRYSGRIPYVEVINEAHDKANLFRFSHSQILELTREACRAAREGCPTVRRLINHCCLWAEYARRPNPDGGRRWSPYRYLSDCRSAGVEFDVIGLQLYYPEQDLMEIDRMLNRFISFNRPIQITELSCNSVEGLDPASMRPKHLIPGWHGPWTETMQADWTEAIYSLCYSKPEFEAVGWWNLADVGGHFWPHGGLLHKDLTPKESYRRLQDLQKRWGVAKTV